MQAGPSRVAMSGAGSLSSSAARCAMSQSAQSGSPPDRATEQAACHPGPRRQHFPAGLLRVEKGRDQLRCLLGYKRCVFLPSLTLSASQQMGTQYHSSCKVKSARAKPPTSPDSRFRR